MDCYLCGASNPPDADFCTRCDGQLLKIGLDAEFHDEPELDELPGEVDGAPEDEADAPGTPKKLRQLRLKSVEDSRLSDALGLGAGEADGEWDDDAPIAFPKAGPAAGIPMIGTRQPPPTAEAMVERSSRPVYVLLGMLFAVVAWMAYNALFIRDDSLPESLALTNTTLAPQTTSTTEAPPRPWSSAEVGGKFGPTFVRVTLIDCPIEQADAPIPTQPLEEWTVFGVTVNEHSVLVAGSDLRTADVATIRSRFGNTALARISLPKNGVGVATTDRSLNRTLSLVEEPIGNDVYFVSYDDEFATTTVTTERSDVPIEITVTDQGEATAVRLEQGIAELDLLHEISTYRTTIEENPAPRRGGTICDDAPLIVDSTPTDDPAAENEE